MVFVLVMVMIMVISTVGALSRRVTEDNRPSVRPLIGLTVKIALT